MRDAGDSPPTTENYPARNINSAEVEKPRPTACYLFVYFFYYHSHMVFQFYKHLGFLKRYFVGEVVRPRCLLNPYGEVESVDCSGIVGGRTVEQKATRSSDC